MPFVEDDHDPLAHRLNAMPLIEPPADLHGSIMGAIRREVARVKTPASQRRRQFFAAGWAIAAAIVLVFLVMIPRDDSPVPATMAPEDVTMEVVRTDRAVRLELAAARKVSISIRLHPQSAVVAGVSGAEEASFRDNLTTFTLHGPSQRAVVELRPRGDPRPATVMVSADGKEVIRTEIDWRQ